MIIRTLDDQTLPVYGDGCQVRNWLFVENTCAALMLVLQRGNLGETYNISGGHECRDIDIGRAILAALGKSERLIHYVPDRPGHDRRYGIDDTKIRRLGFSPAGSFAEHLDATISWYARHREWWLPLVHDAEYRDFESAWYGNPTER